jgi:sterol desaturase/sphingolipid hydroxylase (fatty acid hydroxylase superfamily)
MEQAARTIYELGAHLPEGEEPVFRHEMARVFHNGFLEFFSQVHPVVPALMFVPVVLLTLGLSVQAGVGATILPAFLGGLFFWSLMEYVLHRFLFHMPVQGTLTRWLYLTFHGIHHMYPDDRMRLVMVPPISIPLAVLFWIAFSAVLPEGVWQASYAGLVTGYLAYDYSHWATHFLRPKWAARLGPLAPILKVQKRRHLRHHFGDHDRGYGVSTGLWDHVFGTVDPGLAKKD